MVRVAMYAALHRPCEHEKRALVSESRRGKEVAEQCQLAFGRELIAGFLAQLTNGDIFERAALAYLVDLASRHFPDRLANWNSLLPNQDDFSVARDRRN